MKLVTAEDVFPGSIYLCGLPWMRMFVQDAVDDGTIKPIASIKLGHEQSKVVKKGIVFDTFQKQDNDIIATIAVPRVESG